VRFGACKSLHELRQVFADRHIVSSEIYSDMIRSESELVRLIDRCERALTAKKED
jgi:hypothetical protein